MLLHGLGFYWNISLFFLKQSLSLLKSHLLNISRWIPVGEVGQKQGPTAAAGSATQMKAMMHEEAAPQNAGQPGDVLPIQPQLFAAVA